MPFYPSLIRVLYAARLRALPIINTCLTCLFAYALLVSFKSSLRAFFLSSVALLQLKGKVPKFCVCSPINHSPSAYLISFALPCKAVLHAFFSSFRFEPFVTPLYSYFASTFSDFQFCFSFQINLTNIQFSYI